MKNVIINLFGNDCQQDYIDIIISFVEITITILSLVTMFFNINYENNILKLRDIIWKIRNITDFEEINQKLFDYYTIEKMRLKIYDQMIICFRIINIIIILVILAIMVIKICIANVIGEVVLLIIMAIVVMVTIIFIMKIFKTSKENKDIFTYKELINMNRCEEIFEKKLEIVPKIKIFISSNNGDIEIEYDYPLYCYNINIGICLLDKFYYSYNFTMYNDDYFRKNLVVKKSFSKKEINKFLYAELKNKNDIKIKAMLKTGNTEKSLIYNALISTTDEGIMIETNNYRLEPINSFVLSKSMEKDGPKYFE